MEYTDKQLQAQQLAETSLQKLAEERDIWIENAKLYDKKRMEAEKERDELAKENTYIRGQLQSIKCPYGHKNEQGVCSQGYPGCACADDWFAAQDEMHRDIIKERDQLRAQRLRSIIPERVTELTAHRACGNQESDPQNGKLAGYCVICQTPWPCGFAKLKLDVENRAAIDATTKNNFSTDPKVMENTPTTAA